MIKHFSTKFTNISRAIYPLLSIIVIVSSWFQLELTQGYTSKSDIFRNELKYILLNILTLFVIHAFFLIITNSRLLANVIFCSFFTVLAIINYYTVLLHGSPFTIFEIGNIDTAVKYISMYNIVIDRYVFAIIAIFVINTFFNIVFRKYHNKLSFKRGAIRTCILLFTSSLVMYFGYFSNTSIKPQKTIDWTWKYAYQKYGYIPCSIETIAQCFNIVTIPEGYSDNFIDSTSICKDNTLNNHPDIILILNETFYDLDLITDIQSDFDCFENINNLDNTITGYAVVPLVCGGTNNSEFELLTSNSSYLLPNVTPFNVFSMKKENTIVSYLNTLGYTTLAAHPAAANNYNRHRAYPNMGFDYIYFRESFSNVDFYENRELISDESAFNNIINWYEEYSSNAPMFTYLLTIQNHGGYDTNPPSSAIVHTQKDYGNYTNSINEYLSCIHLTDMAFKELTDYYSKVDRDVIICMVGDHAPWFSEFIADDSLNRAEKELLLRSTPYVIWANFDYDYELPEYLSLNYLLPSVLDIAGTKQSSYYTYINSIKDNYPILSSYGVYYDYNFNEYNYTNMDYDNPVNQYFYMEYSNLKPNNHSDFFAP